MSNIDEVYDASNEGIAEVEIIEAGTNAPRRAARGRYIPTDIEQRLLDVLTDPVHRMESITKQCELAGVNRKSYYRAMDKPEFLEFYRERLLDVIRIHAGQLINVAVDQAKRGSFPHLKMLMEMGGLYVNQANVEHTGEVRISVSFVDPESSE